MKRIICLLLALLLAAGSLAACAEKTGPETGAAADTSADPSGSAGQWSETEEQRLTPDIPDEDFQGYEFNVLTRGTGSSTWYSRDIYAEAVTGDIISDAVYSRNKAVEEKYHFTVVETGSDTPQEDALKAAGSGLDIYGMYCFRIKDHMTSLVLQGYVRDLNGIDRIDLDRPYYDRNSRNNFSIDNKLFLVTGDLLTMDNDATRCCLFNKEIFEERRIADLVGGTLYDLTERGEWTLEAMAACAGNATSDANGDGVMGLEDKWGMVSEQFNALAFCNAAGIMLFEKDADDIPVFTGNNEQTLSVLSDIITMLNQDYCRHYSNAYNEAIPQFKDGLVLFYPAQLADVPLLRAMEFNFGIVPLPKLTKDQDSYHSPVTTYGSNCIAVPSAAVEPERSGSIIEALSCESMYVVTPAYFEVSLKSRLSRDADSAKSVDIILNTAVFELAYMWNLAGIYSSICTAFNNNQPSLAAQFKSASKVAKSEINRMVDSIRTSVKE